MGVALITRDGAEVRIEDGRGRVTKLEAEPGKRNAKVTIVAGHLREPVTGWADGTDAELVAIVRAALASADEVPYRIEVVRDRNADPSVPIADLPKRSKFRRLVALGPAAAAANDTWGDAAAQTAAAPDPASSPAPAPDRPAAAATAPPAGTSGPRPSPVEIALGHLRASVIGDEGAERIRFCETFARDLGATDEQINAARAPRPPAPIDADPQAAAARAAELRGALKELRAYLVDRVDPDSMPVIAARQRCLELGATVDQMRWAAGLPPRHQPNDQGAALAARVRDPDRVGERAGAPFDGATDAAARPAVAAHSGLGHRGSAPRGLADPPPFKRTYEDGPLAGALNPSSYEVGEVIGLVKLAQRLLIRRARAIAGEEGSVVAPTVEQVHGLARALMLAADRVQVSIRGDGSSVDRMSGLYRRATSAVWEAIDWYPYPGPEADAPAVAGWHAAVVEHAQTTIRVGLELLGQHLPAAPPPAAEPVAPTGDPVAEPVAEGVPA
jgi:hypothetical protein